MPLRTSDLASPAIAARFKGPAPSESDDAERSPAAWARRTKANATAAAAPRPKAAAVRRAPNAEAVVLRTPWRSLDDAAKRTALQWRAGSMSADLMRERSRA